MPLSNYPSGFRGGALIKNIPMFDTIDGNVFWVDSGTGGAGNPGTFNSPLASITGAIAKCTASNGDVIFCKSGHTENCATAGAITVDKAGVTIVGLGKAGDMAQIRFITNATADLLVSAASVRFINMRFTAAVADVTAAIDVDASGSEFISCKFDEEGTDLNYVIVIAVATALEGFKMLDCDYIGNDASNDNLVSFAGTHTNTQIVGNRMSHLTAQTASAGFIVSATQQVNMTLSYNFMHSESAAAAASYVVLTGTTNNGWAIGNQISSVDTDATAANALSGFDVTGLHCSGNFFTSGVADTYGIESFLTIEDLT